MPDSLANYQSRSHITSLDCRFVHDSCSLEQAPLFLMGLSLNEDVARHQRVVQHLCQPPCMTWLGKHTCHSKHTKPIGDPIVLDLGRHRKLPSAPTKLLDPCIINLSPVCSLYRHALTIINFLPFLFACVCRSLQSSR